MFGREYRDLADLLLNNERAKHFYKSLPQDIRYSPKTAVKSAP